MHGQTEEVNRQDDPRHRHADPPEHVADNQCPESMLRISQHASNDTARRGDDDD